MGLLGKGATIDTLLKRIRYGGRKARRAAKRLDGKTFVHPAGGRITFRVTKGPSRVRIEAPDFEKTEFALATAGDDAV